MRVVLCDDIDEYRRLVRMELEEDPRIRVVGEAADGRLGVEMIDDLAPDVVVLDLAMPEVGGAEAISLMRARSPRTQVIVLSGLAANGMAAASVVEHEAFKYLRKGETGETIRRAVLAAGSAN